MEDIKLTWKAQLKEYIAEAILYGRLTVEAQGAGTSVEPEYDEFADDLVKKIEEHFLKKS